MPQVVQLPDGRALEVHELGDRDGFPVVFHHGTPGSGELYERWRTPDVRLLGYDRAGYGGSGRKAGRAVVDVVADIEAVADALGFERFATWGLSGGGPHALACAARLGERVTAAASVAGVGPWGVEGLDWLEGMDEGNQREFELVLRGEDALRPTLEDERAGLLGVSVEELRETMAPHLSGADRRALTGELAEYLHANMAHGLAENVDGWLDDDLAFAQPWGFDLASIERPVLVVQGDDDLMVPHAHGVWLAGHVPGAEARLEPAHGHLTLVQDLVPEIHAWLLAHS